jgi:hypothetical protein
MKRRTFIKGAASPKIEGYDGAIFSFAEYLYELAAVG